MNNIMKLADAYAEAKSDRDYMDDQGTSREMRDEFPAIEALLSKSRAALEAAVTQQAEEIERLTATVKILQALHDEDTLTHIALQAKLSAMEVVEPVAWMHEFIGDHKRLSYTPHIADVDGDHRKDAVRVTPLFTAPKVIPLTDEQIEQAVETYGIPWARYREDKYGFQTIPILSRYDYDFARAIEATIRGQQP